MTFQSACMLLGDGVGVTLTEAKGEFTCNEVFAFLPEGMIRLKSSPSRPDAVCRGSKDLCLLLEGSPMSVCGKFRKRSERQSLAGSVGQTIPFLPKLAL